MTIHSDAADAEFGAMQAIYKALETLDDDARKRVIDYIIARLEITASGPTHTKPADAADAEEEVLQLEEREAPKYSSFAELFDAAGPQTTSDKALAAGYWLQVCQGNNDFDGFSANKELKNLGEGLPNITNAITALKGQKPALALQLKKSGKTQQARKTYKLTVAGVKAVEAMING